MLRDVVDRLPIVPTLPQMAARLQPIALEDTVRYLVGLAVAPTCWLRTFDIGGPDVLTYRDLLRAISLIRKRSRWLVPVPGILTDLSTWFVVLLTQVDRQTARALFESMPHDLICRESTIQQILPGALMTVRESLASAERELTSWMPSTGSTA